MNDTRAPPLKLVPATKENHHKFKRQVQQWMAYQGFAVACLTSKDGRARLTLEKFLAQKDMPADIFEAVSHLLNGSQDIDLCHLLGQAVKEYGQRKMKHKMRLNRAASDLAQVKLKKGADEEEKREAKEKVEAMEAQLTSGSLQQELAKELAAEHGFSSRPTGRGKKQAAKAAEDAHVQEDEVDEGEDLTDEDQLMYVLESVEVYAALWRQAADQAKKGDEKFFAFLSPACTTAETALLRERFALKWFAGHYQERAVVEKFRRDLGL